MRIHILSALLGITATLLAVAMFSPDAAPTTHAQNDGVIQLDPEWNNVAYTGDPLPIEGALNDALGITESVWVWRSLAKSWDSWTQGALELLNSLASLDRGDVVWMRTTQPGTWTQVGAAQAGLPGPAGLSCWDLDGDGDFDPATEDRNGDGVADAGDCRGEPGRACWDLNANGEPDPAEDIDGDGTANALDCQGTVGELSSVFLTTAVRDVVRVEEQSGPRLFANAVSVPCPSGTVLTGGGFLASSGNQTVHVLQSRPNGNGWLASSNGNGESHTLTVYAFCAVSAIVLGGTP